MAIFAGVLTLIPGNHRAFSLADPTISFPYTVHETISTSTLVLAAVVAPIIITFLIVLIVAPGPTVSKYVPKRLIWNRKLWELNTAWLGLAMSVITSLIFTDGMKIMFGKARPDLLARCQPDLDNVAQYIVGGLGTKVLEGQYLVDWHICKQSDPSILSDGFMSFPSGHNASTFLEGLVGASSGTDRLHSILGWPWLSCALHMRQVRHFDPIPTTRRLQQFRLYAP